MERKKTILIAIFINAGLLATLFIASLTMQDDLSVEETNQLSQNEVTVKPLYTDFSDALVLNQTVKKEESPSLPSLQLPLAAASLPKEEPVIHHLPPVVKAPVEKEKVEVIAQKPKSSPAPVAKQPAPSQDYYTVKVGDNPWTIAMKHHMKLEELLRMNSLNEEKARKLKPGDRLRIR
jgi:LysM repeat protein